MSDQRSDAYEISELANDYGHLVDSRRWTEFDRLFTDDVVFDASDFGGEPRSGLAQLQEDFAALGDRHPICHHVTNVVVDFEGEDRARVRSKGFCLNSDGSMFSCVYLDEAVRTGGGWRISKRTALLRRPWADANEAQLEGRLS